MKLLAPLLLFALASCARLELRLANTSGAGLRQVEIRTSAGTTTLPGLEDGETHVQKLKLKADSEVNVNFSNAQGQQFYTSSPLKLSARDSGFVLLSVTAKGTLDAVDGRKPK